ncbi:multidrug resistance protein [Pseudozyma hubeiensis SY62]|uniref:Multidrug resistance protein n=1 Tax=Pseudozyma hubeiensis (strain SY62) TaxID=1305764 RepID=R9P7V7_PSEHS|nr:multidrug resistance protein [Pseudozyma hubeiensis SY62]GAC97317.1 multidrug resistance protein [Pseudozyma hubeiensis SY62]
MLCQSSPSWCENMWPLFLADIIRFLVLGSIRKSDLVPCQQVGSATRTRPNSFLIKVTSVMCRSADWLAGWLFEAVCEQKGRRAPAAARIERPAVAGEKAAAELEARLEVAAGAAEVEVPATELEARLAEDEAAVLDAAADDEAREADDEAAEEAAEVEEAAPLEEAPDEAAAFKHELSDEPKTTTGEA